MANSFGRMIQEGEIIVANAKYFKPEFRHLDNRVVVAKGGFGLAPFTAGRAVYGQDLFSREEFRWNGHDFDPVETEAVQLAIARLRLDKLEIAHDFMQATNGAAWANDVLVSALLINRRIQIEAQEIFHNTPMNEYPPTLLETVHNLEAGLAGMSSSGDDALGTIAAWIRAGRERALKFDELMQQ